MDSVKLYQDVIFCLTNFVKNEKSRVKLLENYELKKQTIELINDLLFLELEHNCTYNDEKYSAIFGKALVNILKEKVVFIKPENKTVEDVLGDLVFFQTYCFNQYEIEKESLKKQDFEITKELISGYAKVTDEMKEKYLTQKNEQNVEVEIVDKEKEHPDNNKNINLNNILNSNNKKVANPFMNNIPIHPIQDMRFYPYTSKPKYTYWLKIALSVAMALSAILFIIAMSLFQYMPAFLLTKTLNDVSGFDSDTISKWKDAMTKKGIEEFKWTIAFSMGMGLNTGGIFSLLMISGVVVWVIYSTLQPPKVYRQKFVIPGMVLMLQIIYIILIGFTFFNGINYLFGRDVPYESLTRFIYNNTIGSKNSTLEDFNNWFKSNQVGLENLIGEINKHFNMNLVKTISALLFANLAIYAIILIVAFVMNPKLDRAKIAKANNEYQMLISETMQGRSYEIDQSIFEPQEEIDIFLKEVEKRRSKNNKNNNDQENDKD